MSKPVELGFESGRRRYQCERLLGDLSASVLEKACHYWANYNQRILDDLTDVESLSLKFSDLIEGQVAALESFMEIELKSKTLAPVNANKPIRAAGKFAAFADWPDSDQATFWEICGPVMKQLKYLD